jgi:hypothetical protein
MAELDATSGTATLWAASADNNVNAIVVNGSIVYAGGDFTNINGAAMPYLTALTTAVLPVHFLSFTANRQQDINPVVICKWTTAGEETVSYFTIERSSDARNYSAIGIVPAVNDPSRNASYSFNDNNPLPATAWYRIRQIDKNGSYNYSKIITISAASDQFALRLYPNPVRQYATLQISLSEKELVRYTIIDQAGKTIASSTVYLDRGNNSISLPVQTMANGVYTIQLSGIKTNKQVRFVKQ